MGTVILLNEISFPPKSENSNCFLEFLRHFASEPPTINYILEGWQICNAFLFTVHSRIVFAKPA